MFDARFPNQHKYKFGKANHIKHKQNKYKNVIIKIKIYTDHKTWANLNHGVKCFVFQRHFWSINMHNGFTNNNWIISIANNIMTEISIKVLTNKLDNYEQT